MSVVTLSTPRGRDVVAREAVFDQERRYRYWLMREWDSREPTAVICAVNPSRADHENDDPTIVKLMRWLRGLGYGSLVMVNLFALVSPDPADLERAADPIGPHNDYYLEHAATMARDAGNRFVCAWGRNGLYKHRARVIMARLAELEVPTWCFAVNADGTPTHPGRTAYTSRLLEYRFETVAGDEAALAQR